jgi:hypothetical protein
MPGARTWRAADSIPDQAEHKQCQDRLRDNLTAAGAPATMRVPAQEDPLL